MKYDGTRSISLYFSVILYMSHSMYVGTFNAVLVSKPIILPKIFQFDHFYKFKKYKTKSVAFFFFFGKTTDPLKR